MHRWWILPLVMVIFGLLSSIGLRSIAPSLAFQQFMFFVVGLTILLSTAKIPFSTWKQYGWWLYGLMVMGLALTLVFADETRGSTRWITLAGINIQTSQLAIPFGALVASLVAEKSKQKALDFVKLLGLVMLPAGLIFVQPDLGTTMVYLLSVGTVIFLSTQKWQYLAGLSLAGLVAIGFAWMFLLEPFQKDRVFDFMGYSQEQSADVAYNAHQALIAVGSGQLYGRGLGQGVQSHLRFLPERQTDFIFASLAEELGLAGSLLIVGLYIILITFLLFAASQAHVPSERWYITAMVVMTAVQAGINIGMNIGLVPITGVTLPFLSYGGSSVLSLSLSFGLVQSILLKHRKKAIQAFS